MFKDVINFFFLNFSFLLKILEVIVIYLERFVVGFLFVVRFGRREVFLYFFVLRIIGRSLNIVKIVLLNFRRMYNIRLKIILKLFMIDFYFVLYYLNKISINVSV